MKSCLTVSSGKMLCLLLILTAAISISSFNIDVDIPVIRKSDQLGSYFGFSVALHRFNDGDTGLNNSWLLVGAPRANDSVLTQHSVWNSGALYNCDVLQSANCEQINFDDRGNKKDGNKLTEDKNDQWFGVSVASGGYNGYVLACAHRYLYKTALGNYHTFPGRCYGARYIHFLGTGRTTFDYCQSKNQDDASDSTREPDYERYKYCQMGVSSAVIPSTATNIDGIPIIGAPGQFNYEGAVYYYNEIDADPSSDLHQNNSALGYQGYSTTYGKFFNEDKDEVASGAPRFDHIGMVVVFKSVGAGFTVGTTLQPRNKEPGTGFGTAVCGVDFNNDGWSDLLVGAPFYSEKGLPGEGKVFVYENKLGSFELQSELVIRKYRANFGRALASLGDINLDGFDDVAIGAPYEDATGTVYIHLGSSSGLQSQPAQVIRASAVQDTPVSFGHSISGGQDMDQNGYPDVLVGAYEADTVVLLRTKPVVSIEADIKIEPAAFNVGQEKNCDQDYQGEKMPTICFNITVCATYKELSGLLKDELAVVMTMRSDVERGELSQPRVLFRSNNEDTVNKTEDLITSPASCFKWEAFLRSDRAAEYPDITFRLRYEMAALAAPPTPPPSQQLAPLGQLAVLDQTTPQYTTQVLKFKRDCVKCVPDLTLTSTSKDTLAVGAEDYIVDLAINNTGDSAYVPKLFVTIPDEVTKNAVLNATGKKEVSIDHLTGETVVANNDTLLDIDLGRESPLRGETTTRIKIRLDTRRFSKSQDFLIIHVHVNSSNAEDPSTMKDNTLDLNITITSKADLEVNGTGVEEQVSYGGEVVGESAMVREEDIGNEVKHKYYVKNLGPDLVPNAEIVIDWPFEAESGKHLLYLMDVDVRPESSQLERRCHFKPGQKNLLDLKVKPRSSESVGEDTRNTTAKRAVQRRRRRAADDGGTDGGKARRDAAKRPASTNSRIELDCAHGTARCTKIRCTTGRLDKGDEVTFTVRSRLWNGTLLEDYNGQEVDIVSRASAQPAVSFVQELDWLNNKAEVGTQFNPDYPPPRPKELPSWVIPVAVVGAVLLLAIIVFCLFKLGFFKRQKFDGNMTETEDGTKEEKQKIFGEVY